MASCACAICDIAAITAYLRSRVPALRSAATSPEIAVVCGSGLSRLSDLIEDPVRVAYADIPRFPQATVAGHGTELVFGTLGGRRVVAHRSLRLVVRLGGVCRALVRRKVLPLHLRLAVRLGR